MKFKGKTKKIRIKEILHETKSGKGIWVELANGIKTPLPVDFVEFGTDEIEGRVAIVPFWLKILEMDNNKKEGDADEAPF